MERDYLPLTAYSEEQRQAAMENTNSLFPILGILKRYNQFQKKRLFQDAHYNIG